MLFVYVKYYRAIVSKTGFSRDFLHPAREILSSVCTCIIYFILKAGLCSGIEISSLSSVELPL